MNSSSTDPPAPTECPTCDATGVMVVVTGPDAEAIRFSCGCPVPVEVIQALMSGAPFDDALGAADDERTGGDRP
jgi:hypothetical protein